MAARLGYVLVADLSATDSGRFGAECGSNLRRSERWAFYSVDKTTGNIV